MKIICSYSTDILQSLDNNARRARLGQVENPYQDTFSSILEPEIGFTTWLPSWPPQPIFWIQGKLGARKSTLMKYVVQQEKTLELLNSTPVPRWHLITFFFHDRGTSIQKTVDGLLQEVLYQLLGLYPILASYLVPLRIQAVLDSVVEWKWSVLEWDFKVLITIRG
jgi:hypothetical protein